MKQTNLFSQILGIDLDDKDIETLTQGPGQTRNNLRQLKDIKRAMKAADIMDPDNAPHPPQMSPQDLNQLRMRILEDDYDPDPIEMLAIVNANRQSRRSAARATTNPSTIRKKSTTQNWNSEDLRKILDDEQSG